MTVATMSGEVVSDVQITKADDRIERATFQLESTDLSSLPMRWTVLASGNQAQRAADLLKRGARLHVYGRVFAGGEPRKVFVNLSAFEITGSTSAKG